MSNPISFENRKSRNDAGRGDTGRGDAGAEAANDTEADSFDLDAESMQQLADTVKSLADVVSRRARRASVATQSVARDNPWLTVTAAAVAGVVIAKAVAPRKAQAGRLQSLQQYVPASHHVASYLPSMPAEMPTTRSMGARLESVLEAISQLDPKGSAAPALQKVQEMYGAVRDTVKDTVKSMGKS